MSKRTRRTPRRDWRDDTRSSDTYEVQPDDDKPKTSPKVSK